MKFTAEQIAGILEGEVVGNPNAEVFKLAKIEEGLEGSLTFLANQKYINYIYSTKATITIVNNTFVPEQEVNTTLIKVDDAYKAFSKLLEYYNQVKLMKSGIEEPSIISENVTYGEGLYLGSFCYIGKNVVLKNSTIGPYVSIGENSLVEDSEIRNSLIQTNVHISNASLDNAMIGNHATYNGNFTSVSIGDYTELT